jgi:hypothetical protein
MDAYNDGCTLWFDGVWRHCCEAHDQAYLDQSVTLMTHVDLGVCVVQASGNLTVGIGMAAATCLWWIIVHKLRGKKRS